MTVKYNLINVLKTAQIFILWHIAFIFLIKYVPKNDLFFTCVGLCLLSIGILQILLIELEEDK